MNSRVVALIGPTASGKSEIAFKLARANPNLHILSCDSLLVYRHLEIGTAKPSPSELAEIPHHGINLVDLNQPFTAADYARYAQNVLKTVLAQESARVLIVGGTGFYLKALLFGVWDAPPTSIEFRHSLEKNTSESLHEKLKNLDPIYADKIKPNDRYRVIRALEVMEQSGRKMSDVARAQLSNALPFSVPIFGIRRNKLELEQKIIDRTNAMFSRGLVQETKDLLKHHANNGIIPRALQCVGYKEVIDHLQGKLTIDECRQRVVISTRQLAKKQMTFFKSFPAPIEWYNTNGYT